MDINNRIPGRKRRNRPTNRAPLQPIGRRARTTAIVSGIVTLVYIVIDIVREVCNHVKP